MSSPFVKMSATFGNGVAVDGDVVVVGEPDGDVTERQYEGRAYVYDTVGNLLQNLTAVPPTPRGAFGLDVDIEGDYIVVGECWAPSGELGQVGRVHLYKLGASVEVQEPVEESTTETDEPESETDTVGGIPGFPVLAIITALVVYYLSPKCM